MRFPILGNPQVTICVYFRVLEGGSELVEKKKKKNLGLGVLPLKNRKSQLARKKTKLSWIAKPEPARPLHVLPYHL